MVHFVGAGCGAKDLITLRGKKRIEEADVIIYAGSLVNPALLSYKKEDCVVCNSANMTLEEVLSTIRGAVDEGKTVVRLHTGDPSLYGAIREQMDALGQWGIEYDVTPGVSVFSGAAASLGAEYTLPGISQTLIITRMEGKTAVPEREKLRGLADHGASMALYLSAALCDEVKEELLAGGYDEDTPVAVVYKASWEDEKILRASVGTFAEEMKAAGINKTALILVGKAMGDGAYEKSRLYAADFSTEYRKATEGPAQKGTEKLGWKVTEEPAPKATEGRTQNELVTAIVIFNDEGEWLAQKIKELVSAQEEIDAARPGEERSLNAITVTRVPRDRSLDAWTKEQFENKTKTLIFIGATGIAVRACAPYLSDKMTDPAVLVIDAVGEFVIPILSGHIGGANEKAKRIANLLGARAVITTATDRHGAIAVDTWAKKMGYEIYNPKAIKHISSAILKGMKVTLISDIPIRETLPDGIYLQRDAISTEEKDANNALHSDRGQPAVVITILESRAKAHASKNHLVLVPKILYLGIGCRKGMKNEIIKSNVVKMLADGNLLKQALNTVASVDIKANEAGIIEFCKEWNLPFSIYKSSELKHVSGNFHHSDMVEQTVGVDNVCERAAVLASGNGKLLIPWTADNGVTMAIAIKDSTGMISVIGIGPGRKAYMTLEAIRAIEEADVIIGYTTYIRLLKEEFEVTGTLSEKLQFDNLNTESTGMRHEKERVIRAITLAKEGKKVALVSSGDAGIYGMAGLLYSLCPKETDFSIRIISGVTAAVSGAARLGSPLSNDFCVISLSDIMMPWEVIEKRLLAAAKGDFVIVLYNPGSKHRPDHLMRALHKIAPYYSADTVCGVVEKIGREGERARVLRFEELTGLTPHMEMTVFIGNSETKSVQGMMVTMRGYRGEEL